jgi:hypothetical protein
MILFFPHSKSAIKESTVKKDRTCKVYGIKVPMYVKDDGTNK